MLLARGPARSAGERASRRSDVGSQLPRRERGGSRKTAVERAQCSWHGAQLDPLGSEPPGDPTLDPSFHDVSEEDLEKLPSSVLNAPGTGPSSIRWGASLPAIRRWIPASTT